MEVKLIVKKNQEKPLKEYETSFIWTGFGRYNTFKKTIEKFTIENNKLLFSSIPADNNIVLSRNYYTELATIKEYSNGDWTENENYFEKQKN
jgi:hypothetical protein